MNLLTKGTPNLTVQLVVDGVIVAHLVETPSCSSDNDDVIEDVNHDDGSPDGDSNDDRIHQWESPE
jgi:hypothetical protein